MTHLTYETKEASKAYSEDLQLNFKKLFNAVLYSAKKLLQFKFLEEFKFFFKNKLKNKIIIKSR